MDSLDGYVADDELAVGPLAELGFKVDTLSWRDTTVDWNDYEAVIIRTPWDYQRTPDEFLSVLKTIDDSSARLENSFDIVRWNLDKRYLIDMEQRGCRIVPTIWDAAYSGSAFDSWLERLGTDELIIKPTVSATAEHTYRLVTYDPELKGVFANRSFMAQPFMPNIVAEGEYSVFFFNGEYSHTVNKSPKTADFRVQEEHGGIITEVEPDEKLRFTAQNALDKIGEPLLFARVDLVRDDEDKFALMELELIEPALYLRMSAGAPERFAAAIETLLK
ncbi:MAG: hypothetical protein ABL952_08200 [Pyrinomonadaceae bacterium]